MRLLVLIFALSLSANVLIGQTVSDTRNVLQLSLDIDQFEGFYNPEIVGRIPLVIQNTGIVPEVNSVIKFGKEVRFSDPTELFFFNKKDFLIFEEFRIADSEAYVHFTFPFEGVFAKISLAKNDGEWSTTSVIVGEL